MIRILITIILLPFLYSNVPRSNPTLSGYRLLENPYQNPTFIALDREIKNKHQQLRGAFSNQVEVTANMYDWRISYTDPLDKNSYFITQGTYIPIGNRYDERSWFIVSYQPNFIRTNSMVVDKAYAPQQIVRNVEGFPNKMGILYFSPAYGQILSLKIPKNQHFFTKQGEPKVTTDLLPQFQKFQKTARILQQTSHLQQNKLSFKQNNRLLQQIPSTPIRLINISDFLVNIPGGFVESVPATVPAGETFSKIFDKFNAQITTQLKSQNISFSEFPPFPKDNSTNQIMINTSQTPVIPKLVPTITNYTQTNSYVQDTSNLPDVIPIRPLYTAASYQIVSNLSNSTSAPVQMLIAPAQNITTQKATPMAINHTIITSDYLTKPQPRIDSRASIINAFRSLQIGNASNYLIQQADFNFDPNLVGVLRQLKDEKNNDLKDMTTIYAEFVFLPATNITSYNIIFKNSTRYAVVAIQLPYKLLNYYILSPTQINPLCNAFDSNGNCTVCSSRSYFAPYKICLVVNQLCQAFNNKTGQCTNCYQGYILQKGECAIDIDNFPGCYKRENNVCIACSQRYYLKDGSCQPVSDLCKTWNSDNGNCLSCYPGYNLVNGVCST